MKKKKNVQELWLISPAFSALSVSLSASFSAQRSSRRLEDARENPIDSCRNGEALPRKSSSNLVAHCSCLRSPPRSSSLLEAYSKRHASTSRSPPSPAPPPTAQGPRPSSASASTGSSSPLSSRGGGWWLLPRRPRPRTKFSPSLRFSRRSPPPSSRPGPTGPPRLRSSPRPSF